MRFNTVILTGMAVLFISGCSSPSGVDADFELEDIVGGWTWVSSAGGLFYQVQTPEGTGQTRRLTFGADGLAEFFVNGEPTLALPFEVGIGAEGSQFAGRSVVRYGAAAPVVPEQGLELRGDTLILDDGCCDLFVHTYVRASS